MTRRRARHLLSSRIITKIINPTRAALATMPPTAAFEMVCPDTDGLETVDADEVEIEDVEIED